MNCHMLTTFCCYLIPLKRKTDAASINEWEKRKIFKYTFDFIFMQYYNDN
ncbi:hypothetical protein A0O32_0190 [Anoxybacillus flavithermus]|uniref:Uncharacterized protein n=1 Tax=Anoxybacillus flavithermus TaxID=33934 RepID=A0A178TD95_9BACL|nr:hypothetical protein TAF16_1618 [Anoxybacillus flavithermus]OAO84025.1 hypothetical protein A0O32_0190 [Anoxybacillus flavithermus]